jgi:predicted solute-binding protein
MESVLIDEEEIKNKFVEKAGEINRRLLDSLKHKMIESGAICWWLNMYYKQQRHEFGTEHQQPVCSVFNKLYRKHVFPM